MKEEIYNLSSDICHLSLEDTESPGFFLMTDERHQETSIDKSFPPSFILYPSAFFHSHP